MLQRNRETSVKALRTTLGLTEGNLGSHVAKLEESGYVATKRGLSAKGFEQRIRLTTLGRQRLGAYLAELSGLLRDLQAPADGPRTGP